MQVNIFTAFFIMSINQRTSDDPYSWMKTVFFDEKSLLGIVKAMQHALVKAKWLSFHF